MGLLKFFYPGLMILSFGWATELLISRMPGSGSFSTFMSMRVKVGNLLVLAVILLVWHLLFTICGFYQSQRLASPVLLAFDSAKATTLSAVAIAMIGKLFQIKMVTPEFGIIFWLLSSGVILTAR